MLLLKTHDRPCLIILTQQTKSDDIEEVGCKLIVNSTCNMTIIIISFISHLFVLLEETERDTIQRLKNSENGQISNILNKTFVFHVLFLKGILKTWWFAGLLFLFVIGSATHYFLTSKGLAIDESSSDEF